jgi:malate dehydrogenase (oxaloacetate-decarboxylating)
MQTSKTLRLHHVNSPDAFTELVAALSANGMAVLEVATHHVGQRYIYRDVTVSVAGEKDLDTLLTTVRLLPGIIVESVVDEVLRVHEGGKMIHRGRFEVTSFAQLREVYTPGVAKVCREIQRNPELARRYTNAGNTVAVVSNGSRVLGLGNIGPLACLPVMEAKAMFYGQLVGLNAVPIVLDAYGVDAVVATVERLAVGFAGIHLEDIQTPDCMEIERRLVERLSIPVMHDDQHGTAVVTLAAVHNLLRLAGRDLSSATFAQVGLGAAGLAIATLVTAAGGARVLGSDRSPAARAMAEARGVECVEFDEAIARADVLCMTTGVSGLLAPERVRKGQIVLALSNPSPEIEPADALNAGAAAALDGRSVNNLLAYPGIFRGAIDAQARAITTLMKLRAAEAIAGCAQKDEILPDPLSSVPHRAVAEAVRRAAAESRA